MESKLLKDYVIPSHACDYAGQLGLSGLAGQFMDIATEHADLIGIGFADLKKDDLFWVAVRTRIEIFRKPEIGERVLLETWTEPPTRITFDRDYVLTAGGGRIAAGKTQWALFNTALGRLEMGRNVYPPELEPIAQSSLEGAYYRFAEDPSGEPLGEYTVRSTDIDLGGHMNNVAYVRALESMFSVAQLKEYGFRSVELHYKKPCFEGDTLVFTQRQSDKGLIVRGAVNGATCVWLLLN